MSDKIAWPHEGGDTMTEVIGEEEALKYRRAVRKAMANASSSFTIKDRLVQWLNDPLEGEGPYIDTLEPLVQDMLKEQRQMCAKSVLGMSVDDIAYDACLDTTGEEK